MNLFHAALIGMPNMYLAVTVSSFLKIVVISDKIIQLVQVSSYIMNTAYIAVYVNKLGKRRMKVNFAT